MEVVQPRPCKRYRRYARDKTRYKMKSYEKECNDDTLIYIYTYNYYYYWYLIRLRNILISVQMCNNSSSIISQTRVCTERKIFKKKHGNTNNTRMICG